MTDLPPPVPQYPSPPPTAAGPIRRSTWPTVIGIVFMVMGALGAIGGIFELLGPMLMGAMGDMMPDEMPDVMAPMVERSGLIYARGALLMVVAILLIVAGIGVVGRRPWGVPLAIVWGVLKLGVVVFDAWLDMVLGRDMMAAMSDMGTTPPQMALDSFLYVGMAFTIAWGWILPIFTFIWFAVPKIRADVRTWGTPPPTEMETPYAQ